jgi:hypothetical protein
MKTCWPNLKGRRITQKRKISKVATLVVVFVVVFAVTLTLNLDQYAAEMELEMEMETTAPGTWSCLVLSCLFFSCLSLSCLVPVQSIYSVVL